MQFPASAQDLGPELAGCSHGMQRQHMHGSEAAMSGGGVRGTREGPVAGVCMVVGEWKENSGESRR